MTEVGALELGGTRAVVCVGGGPDQHGPVVEIATTSPEETLDAVCAAFETFRREGRVFDRIGVASFGPIGVDPARPGFGRIGSTPKPGWSGADVAGVLERRLGAAVVLDTDVNGAAVGEGLWGAAAGLRSHAYITVGTGVGVGLVIEGRPVHGHSHPEGGHLRVRRASGDDYPGRCPWHRDCLEGLICGPALEARLGFRAEEARDDDPVWTLVGYYLGEACAMLALTAAPERIVIGGGVGRRPEVLAEARRALGTALAGYVAALPEPVLDRYLVSPGLGGRSGLFGAMAMALNTSDERLANDCII